MQKVSHVLLEPLGPSNVLESQFDTDFKEEPIDKPKSRAASLLDRVRLCEEYWAFARRM